MGIDFMSGDLVRHAEHGLGVVTDAEGFGEHQQCKVRFVRGERTTVVQRRELEMLSEAQSETYDLFRLALREARTDEQPLSGLAERWRGGELLLKPADPAQAAKSVPIESFFHKIVMVRDRLRVLEAHLNAHPGMDDAEKVEMQQYITRIYGSLTTFNVLFREKKDWFVGQKGET